MAKIVQLTRIESGTWAFQRAINQGRASFLTSPKWYSDDQICRFFTEISTKPKHYKYATKFHFFLKTFSDKVVAKLTTYRTVSTFCQGMTPLP